MTLRLKRRASLFFSMNEGRKSQVVLLDERRLDIIIQPKLYSFELLDLVASHFKLREKRYFGLGFFDETNHFNWLQGEKRVLDHDFPKKTGLLVLHFSIKFYVDTIGLLRDTQTVELFYLNARQALFRGQIECDSETVFELAAHALQTTNGDAVSDEETREELKKFAVIPTRTLKEHPSLCYCEDRVICFYEKLAGSSRGMGIVNYMTIVEKLPTYGIHYYEVKDKKDIPWWLGISPRGISVYDKKDKTTPRKVFTWKLMENLYHGDKKFSIEVQGPKRDDTNGQVSVSRRTFGASNVDVHAWYASSAQLTKSIWSMAVEQHQFYLDRKQSRSHLPTARSMSEIAADLCRSTTSLPGSLGSDLSRSPSSHSLPSLSNSRYDLTIEQTDSLKAEREMYQALKAKKEAYMEALKRKTEELKKLCFQEGEITGQLPPETPLAPGEQPPTFRRRVGTAFSLNAKTVVDMDSSVSSELSKLELEVDLQGKITSAALRLASDKTVNKQMRKQRRQSYTRAVGKLKEMEKALVEMQEKAGQPNSSSSTTTTATPSAGEVRQGGSSEGMYRVLGGPRGSSPCRARRGDGIEEEEEQDVVLRRSGGGCEEEDDGDDDDIVRVSVDDLTMGQVRLSIVHANSLWRRDGDEGGVEVEGVHEEEEDDAAASVGDDDLKDHDDADDTASYLADHSCSNSVYSWDCLSSSDSSSVKDSGVSLGNANEIGRDFVLHSCASSVRSHDSSSGGRSPTKQVGRHHFIPANNSAGHHKLTYALGDVSQRLTDMMEQNVAREEGQRSPGLAEGLPDLDELTSESEREGSLGVSPFGTSASSSPFYLAVAEDTQDLSRGSVGDATKRHIVISRRVQTNVGHYSSNSSSSGYERSTSGGITYARRVSTKSGCSSFDDVTGECRVRSVSQGSLGEEEEEGEEEFGESRRKGVLGEEEKEYYRVQTLAANTRVTRRKTNLIMAKGLKRPEQIHQARTAAIIDGYRKYEELCLDGGKADVGKEEARGGGGGLLMGEEEEEGDSVDGREKVGHSGHDSLAFHRQVIQRRNVAVPAAVAAEAVGGSSFATLPRSEFNRKVQDLIDAHDASFELTRPLVRSRSLDNSRACRLVSPEDARTPSDDLTLVTSPTGKKSNKANNSGSNSSSNSSSSNKSGMRNPFSFFHRSKREKSAKKMSHSVSDTLGLASSVSSSSSSSLVGPTPGSSPSSSEMARHTSGSSLSTNEMARHTSGSSLSTNEMARHTTGYSPSTNEMARFSPANRSPRHDGSSLRHPNTLPHPKPSHHSAPKLLQAGRLDAVGASTRGSSRSVTSSYSSQSVASSNEASSVCDSEGREDSRGAERPSWKETGSERHPNKRTRSVITSSIQTTV